MLQRLTAKVYGLVWQQELARVTLLTLANSSKHSFGLEVSG